jgi:hypothetical protein
MTFLCKYQFSITDNLKCQFEKGLGNLPKNRDGVKSHCVIEYPNCVVEKTVRRAGRAWYISLREM